MSTKSERLRKLETELSDLEQWLKLGLVPKKDLQKHKEEIETLHHKIAEEKERLRFLKESGDVEEAASTPKRPAHGRAQFQDPHSLADVDVVDEGLTDIGIDVENESYDFESSSGDEEGDEGDENASAEEEEEEDPFSDRNRWKRGILEDPDAKDW